MRLQAVKGTYDILPEDQARWRDLRSRVATTLERAGVREITTPIFEYSEVFLKSVGESADLVVQKEMYTFEDRGGRNLPLRPEFTAGVLRAYMEHGMHTWRSPVKLGSMGPAFRAENVQRGRYRQFHQVNCELLGQASPLVDAEAIALMYTVLTGLGLEGMTVKLGSVGDPEDRARYNEYLRQELTPHESELSETSRTRLALNPMRILDAKDEGDQALIHELKRPLDLLGDEARQHFEEVQRYLTQWQVPYELDPSIVRGLDYYRRTAFEVHHQGIGAQSALGGGGRYDGLVESMGGPATPGIGWAFGIERVLDAIQQRGSRQSKRQGPRLFLVPLDDEAVAELAGLAQKLRTITSVEFAYARRNPGKGLKEADRAGARYAVMRGKSEREQERYTVKELDSGDQFEVSPTQLEALAQGLDEEQ